MLVRKATGYAAVRKPTVAEWAIEYKKQILAQRDICDKTKANKLQHLAKIVKVLGADTLETVRPCRVADLMQAYSEYEQTAKKLYEETKAFWYSAVAAGWTDSNPVQVIAKPKAHVVRRRLMLADWQKMYIYAALENKPSWIERMLLLALLTGQRRADLQKMRFSDAYDGLLHIKQQKTGTLVAIPVKLKLDSVGISIEEAVESCRYYAPLHSAPEDWLLRKTTGDQLCLASMSWRFEELREAALEKHSGDDAPASLHECRSLAEREYYEMGIDTMTLLGHSSLAMTAQYHRDRGAAKRLGVYTVLEI